MRPGASSATGARRTCRTTPASGCCTPTALLGDGPPGAYHGALVTNALLAALLTLAAWWVAGLAGSLRPPPVRFAAACAVGLYTSFVGYSSLAAPEVAFAALELALVGVFARALRDRRARGGRWPEPAAASRGCCTPVAPA